MPSHPNKLSVQLPDEFLKLHGEVHALKAVLAIVIAHVSLLSRAPLNKRDEILGSINSMMPGALAKIEQDGSPSEAAGFERAIEVVTSLASSAVRIEPVTSAEQG